MMRIETRVHKGILCECKCYSSLRNGVYYVTKVRPIRPRKTRSDKGKLRGSRIKPSSSTTRIRVKVSYQKSL